MPSISTSLRRAFRRAREPNAIMRRGSFRENWITLVRRKGGKKAPDLAPTWSLTVIKNRRPAETLTKLDAKSSVLLTVHLKSEVTRKCFFV